LMYIAFTHALLPGLPSNIRDLRCCTSVPCGGKATVSELVAGGRLIVFKAVIGLPNVTPGIPGAPKAC
jgi:hypothetical protein